MTTAAAYAHLGAMPMVMITGQKAIRSSRQARFLLVTALAVAGFRRCPRARREREVVEGATRNAWRSTTLEASTACEAVLPSAVDNHALTVPVRERSPWCDQSAGPDRHRQH